MESTRGNLSQTLSRLRVESGFYFNTKAAFYGDLLLRFFFWYSPS